MDGALQRLFERGGRPVKLLSVQVGVPLQCTALADHPPLSTNTGAMASESPHECTVHSAASAQPSESAFGASRHTPHRIALTHKQEVCVGRRLNVDRLQRIDARQIVTVCIAALAN